MVGGEWTKQRMIARQSICGQSYSMGREMFARQRHHVRRKSISVARHQIFGGIFRKIGFDE
jgi:hypothetical protein